MKILFLTTAFNGLTQRAWLELDQLNHQVKVHIATDDQSIETAVAEFDPDLIIAPFLKKRIPESVWKKYVCLIVHPGIVGDRGSSSLDWAILNQVSQWGVSILQAAEKMDSGAVWATYNFPMRETTKACLYRHEVTQAAIKCLLEAVQNFQDPEFKPIPPENFKGVLKGKWNRPCIQSDYRFSWRDNTDDILRKLQAADSDPGVLIEIFGEEYFAFGACLEENLKGVAGHILAQRKKAICIATADKAVWLTQLKLNVNGAIKLPATIAIGEQSANIPFNDLNPFERKKRTTFQEIRYNEIDDVAYIHFDFYNGAMDIDQCNRLRQTLIEAKQRKTKVIVLMGGQDIWSNGIHLNMIENAENPADEAWANILAMDDLVLEIIQSPDHYLISAMRGNAGAGGVPMALAADKVLARQGIVLNPHTKNMGLYGSEYWTYLLPKRIGVEKARHFTDKCLPWGTQVAKQIGLIDDTFGETAAEFSAIIGDLANEIANLSYFDKLLKAKSFQRKKDERIKPLNDYREEELERMWDNFYSNDEGFDEKRFRFVHKIYDPKAGQDIEEQDLYSSRRKIYRRRKWESIDYH